MARKLEARHKTTDDFQKKVQEVSFWGTERRLKINPRIMEALKRMGWIWECSSVLPGDWQPDTRLLMTFRKNSRSYTAEIFALNIFIVPTVCWNIQFQICLQCKYTLGIGVGVPEFLEIWNRCMMDMTFIILIPVSYYILEKNHRNVTWSKAVLCCCHHIYYMCSNIYWEHLTVPKQSLN